ncbi:hypothetical protein ACQBJO_12980 [Janibacter sp. G349]|uniref:hypothetical protein n=1 Tax=Janibacter sp. G349 TaxID=3405424 RepID=UPI003B765A95
MTDDVATELGRVVRRWQQLPLDRAAERVAGVHELMAELAGEPLPDLGPAVVMDQLRVVVFDVCRAEGESADLAQRLASLRLTWA